MKTEFNYTVMARRFALKYPRLNFIMIQVNFWILAYLLLAFLLHMNNKATAANFGLEVEFSFIPLFIMAVSSGMIFGTLLGFLDHLIDNQVSKCLPMGKMIIFQGIAYFVILFSMTLFLRYILWDQIIVAKFYNDISPLNDDFVWHYNKAILIVYSFVMTLVISFINQMNKKFGPGVLIPMLFGKYRNPKEEERIFMFMDLTASTTIAEKLGHIKYSALIRDSFTDINRVLTKNQAEVYQYVGDEIVVSWPMQIGLKEAACVEFFFSCQKQFSQRSDYYIETYGLIPKFKAGLHQGIVTAVEVGEIKRDIAYHGDTLNTASRIQGKCKEYETELLVSEALENQLNWSEKFTRKFMGDVFLTGKEISVKLFSVQPAAI